MVPAWSMQSDGGLLDGFGFCGEGTCGSRSRPCIQWRLWESVVRSAIWVRAAGRFCWLGGDQPLLLTQVDFLSFRLGQERWGVGDRDSRVLLDLCCGATAHSVV